ncbi:hypothetical protein LR48_Vigan05g045000 [Vigna angularis]|uniref:Uncharacterized protein n=1 Tax=Phaseolus angularis TaxID=3914 RepID=A0A0L9UJH4_PHAAN|nr:uncharacterized protein HKW66_Vig0208940 [Vigna angularis]KOM42846.1 hypothetical protein LR48_Vigan05g045000 [Vigna angularis]
MASSCLSPSQLRATPSRHEVYIESASLALTALGFRAGLFASNNYLSNGYTPRLFSSQLHQLGDLNNRDRLENVCTIGIREKWFDSFALSTPGQFYDFLSFLKTQKGQEALHKMHTREKLVKRGGGALTASDMGFVAMFHAQQNDMSSTISSGRAEIEARLAKAELVVQRIRDELKDFIVDTKVMFVPAGTLVHPPDAQFNRACWQAYLAECGRNGVTARPLSEAMLIDVVRDFGPELRQRAILAHLELPGNRSALEDYCNTQIGFLEARQDHRGAKRFRSLMDAVGAEVFIPVSDSKEGGDGKSNTSRDAEAGGEDQIFSQVDPVTAFGKHTQRRVVTYKPRPTLSRTSKLSFLSPALLLSNLRLAVVREQQGVDRRAIPVASEIANRKVHATMHHGGS